MAAQILEAPNFSPVNLITDKTEPRKRLIVEKEAWKENERFAGQIVNLLGEGRFNAILDSFLFPGIPGDGLVDGALCYPGGNAWLGASNGSRTTAAVGVATSVVGGVATIQFVGVADVLVDITSGQIIPGATLWLGQSAGVATTTRPDPASDVLYQRIGRTISYSGGGKVKTALNIDAEATD